MSKTPEELSDQCRRTVTLLERIEWAAKIVNAKTKFRTDTCPACGGIQPGTYGEYTVGHKPDCELSKLLADLRG